MLCWILLFLFLCVSFFFLLVWIIHLETIFTMTVKNIKILRHSCIAINKVMLQTLKMPTQILTFAMLHEFQHSYCPKLMKICSWPNWQGLTWALSYYSDWTLSQAFQLMPAQLSKNAALPLAKILVTTWCRSSKTGPLLLKNPTPVMEVPHAWIYYQSKYSISET